MADFRQNNLMRKSVADKIRIPNALWEGMRRAGIPCAKVVRQTKIPLSTIRDGSPVSTLQFFDLWKSLADISGETTIGLRIATGLEGAVMPPSFLVAYHAQNFRDALQRVARFKHLCAPEDVLISERQSRCDILVNWPHAQGQSVPPALVDATWAALVEMGRKGTSTALVPASVELARKENNRSVYENYYGCRVIFGAKNNRLSFHRSDLDKSFISYNEELLGILTPELDRRLEQQAYNSSMSEQVKWVLRRRLSAGRPDIRSVSTELAVSERSLQRKLMDEGLTFLNLLSETRHQLALEYLANPTLTIIEVAYMLGYEDQNSFFRAFRQWEELTPSVWRVASLNHKPTKA